jgi:outer membrane receptor protein involved in Fe transport
MRISRFQRPAAAGRLTAISLLGSAAIALAPCPASAADRELAGTIVDQSGATRTEAPADQVGASVTTFTAADLERRRVPLVADLLRVSPGVMVVRSGGPGALTSLFVRGGESNYNKVLLDGIRLNEPGGTFNFSNLSTDSLERVEIVRGAHSALFGSDAMASVVQLVTKRPDRARARPQGTLSIEGGTYGTLRGGASASGASGRIDYAVGAQRFSTDNHVPNHAFDNATLSANVGLAASPTAAIRLIVRSEREHAGTPGQTAFGRPDLDAFFERHDGVGGISFDHQAHDRFRQRAAYSLSASRQQSTNLVADPPYVPRFGARAAPFAFSDFRFDSRTNLQRHHASYQIDWRLAAAGRHGDHLVTALAEGVACNLTARLAGTVSIDILADAEYMGGVGVSGAPAGGSCGVRVAF